MISRLMIEPARALTYAFRIALTVCFGIPIVDYLSAAILRIDCASYSAGQYLFSALLFIAIPVAVLALSGRLYLLVRARKLRTAGGLALIGCVCAAAWLLLVSAVVEKTLFYCGLHGIQGMGCLFGCGK